MAETEVSAHPAQGPEVETLLPHVLVFTLDPDESRCLVETCAALDCEVGTADDPDAALVAAGARAHDVVFVDAGAGERRLGDIMNAARQGNPAVAIILLATG